MLTAQCQALRSVLNALNRGTPHNDPCNAASTHQDRFLSTSTPLCLSAGFSLTPSPGLSSETLQLRRQGNSPTKQTLNQW